MTSRDTFSNLPTAQHGLGLVKATVCRQECSFLADTGADISLPPYSVVEANHLSVLRHMVRQPVMVDGTALQCEGVTDATVTLGPRKVSSWFYVVRGLKYGILGTDVLASLEIQIDVARKRLYIDG